MEINIYRSGIVIEYGNFMTSIHPLSYIFLLCCIFKIPDFVIQHGKAREYSEILFSEYFLSVFRHYTRINFRVFPCFTMLNYKIGYFEYTAQLKNGGKRVN